ncbi:hypothetical protein CK203_101712 [Vitis vinifera]|uniref:Reverse transcriptase Ty1/copia-type domain-containing protein n=1 Tax=Vitis vinifera TaxID=29760 RepID=A0A438DQP6_VITVI|nr:hypothetical protein CK203_101712 [Vitis vinifera]
MERIPRKKDHHWHYPSSTSARKVQIYVDDIIFGATNVSLCEEFPKFMHSEFEMSIMRELNFSLELQIKQLKEGTFINQAKYIRDLLKRFNMEEAKTMKTSMSSSIKLDKVSRCEPLPILSLHLTQSPFSITPKREPPTSKAQGNCPIEQSQPKARQKAWF